MIDCCTTDIRYRGEDWSIYAPLQCWKADTLTRLENHCPIRGAIIHKSLRSLNHSSARENYAFDQNAAIESGDRVKSRSNSSNCTHKWYLYKHIQRTAWFQPFQNAWFHFSNVLIAQKFQFCREQWREKPFECETLTLPLYFQSLEFLRTGIVLGSGTLQGFDGFSPMLLWNTFPKRIQRTWPMFYNFYAILLHVRRWGYMGSPYAPVNTASSLRPGTDSSSWKYHCVQELCQPVLGENNI